MSGQPEIPVELKQQVANDCGNCCAACGDTQGLHFAHIGPWDSSNGRNADSLIYLCARCHAQAIEEDWSVARLQQHRERPWIVSNEWESPADLDEDGIQDSEGDLHTTNLLTAPADATARRAAVLKNENGLHLRAWNSLLQVAAKYTSDVFVSSSGNTATANRMLALLDLKGGTRRGSQIWIEARGPDAEDAVMAICELIENRFGEIE